MIKRILARVTRLVRDSLVFLKSCMRFLYYKYISKAEPIGKLSASINLFDGEELLLDLIHNIRPNVDHLSVVFQRTGHWGSIHPWPEYPRYLEEIKELGLIDALYEWVPLSPQTNIELFNQQDMLKRQVGLDLARGANCDYFINLDNDEFYRFDQFQYMKRVLMRKNSKFNSSVVKHLQYYKNASYVKKNREQEYVMGIFPITKDVNFEYATKIPFPIDPGRKISARKVCEFKRFEIQMHHMSYVRSSLFHKLTSSGAQQGNSPYLEVTMERFDSFKFPQKGIWAHGMEVELKKVKNIISLDYFESNFITSWENTQAAIPSGDEEKP